MSVYPMVLSAWLLILAIASVALLIWSLDERSEAAEDETPTENTPDACEATGRHREYPDGRFPWRILPCA